MEDRRMSMECEKCVRELALNMAFLNTDTGNLEGKMLPNTRSNLYQCQTGKIKSNHH